MNGFLATLTPEQLKAAIECDGPDGIPGLPPGVGGKKMAVPLEIVEEP